MDVGRELDALVAEKVMDLRVRKVIVSEWVRERNYADPGDYVIDWSPDKTSSLCPEYSTDIAAAWRVVNAIHDMISNEARDGKRRDLNFLELSVLSRYGATAATFDLEITSEWYEFANSLPFGARGDSPAHAICLAALKVVGGRS